MVHLVINDHLVVSWLVFNTNAMAIVHAIRVHRQRLFTNFNQLFAAAGFELAIPQAFWLPTASSLVFLIHTGCWMIIFCELICGSTSRVGEVDGVALILGLWQVM